MFTSSFTDSLSSVSLSLSVSLFIKITSFHSLYCLFSGSESRNFSLPLFVTLHLSFKVQSFKFLQNHKHTLIYMYIHTYTHKKYVCVCLNYTFSYLSVYLFVALNPSLLSLSMSISFSHCLSVFLCLSLSLSLSFYVCLCLSLSISVFVFLCLSPFLCQSLSLSVSVYLVLSVLLSFSVSLKMLPLFKLSHFFYFCHPRHLLLLLARKKLWNLKSIFCIVCLIKFHILLTQNYLSALLRIRLIMAVQNDETLSQENWK